MTSSSTSLPSPGRSAEPTGPTLVRATSPAKSRLTIRLPDLNTVGPPAAASASALRQAPMASPINPSHGSELAETATNSPAEQDKQAAGQSPAWIRELPRKTLDLVRQPKFWLACIVAVAVQVVLAFVMTPAEGVSDGKKPPQAPAQAWQKAPEEPAARIVVPAAPVSVPDDHSETAPSVTTPMGPALPFDPTTDITGSGSNALTVDGPDEQVPAARMADKQSHTEGGRSIDRPAQQMDGATLGGIAPLEPGASLEKHETR